MDPRKLGGVIKLDTRYLEVRKVRGKTGFAWNNRHAKVHGLKAEWLGYDPVKAAQRADELNKMYDRSREGVVAYASGSLGWWLHQIERTDEHNNRPDKVRNEVENAFKRLRATPLISAQLKKITGKHCKVLAMKLAEAGGVAKSHRTVKWLRYAFSQAVEDGRLDRNPLAGVKIKRPRARQVVVWEHEVEDLIAHFISIRRSSLALAIRFAFDTSQRSSDLINLSWTRWNNGLMRIRQAKTNATVLVPALPELMDMVGTVTRTSTQIIVSEETGQPYKSDNFSHLINEGFRALGPKDPKTGDPLGLKDEETGQPKVFRDLRRSAVVRLALAGCTIPMISAITGHSYARCEQILETYLPRTSEMAKLAIERLLASRKEA